MTRGANRPLPWDNPAVVSSAVQKGLNQGLKWEDTDWESFDFTDDEWVFLEWADYPVAIERHRDLIQRNAPVGLMQVINSTFAVYRRSQ